MNATCLYRVLTRTVLILVTALAAVSAGPASAADAVRQDEAVLLDSYRRNLARLESNSFGLPLYIESFERDERVHVDVYGIFAHPFENMARALKSPANWCEIVFLHPNVKACSSVEAGGTRHLNLYLGKKSYQPPEDIEPVVFRFRNVGHQGFLEVVLAADDGPYGTKDHRMRLEALPLDAGRTFVHVSYAYSDSAVLRLATRLYFATLGRGKVGFTVTGTDDEGQPVHIGGPRGALERNAVRYYLAIQSFMDTLRYPEATRLDKRIGEWHDLTSRYPKQLLELDRQGYLDLKTREHANQLKLQRLSGTGNP